MLAWVIGSGGMLGSALLRVSAAESCRIFRSTRVPWADEQGAIAVLVDDLRRFADQTAGRPWVITWAAGSSVVASGPESTGTELRILNGLLDAMSASVPDGPGAFFLTSSAGGVFAGSQDPPFHARSVPHPISPYGQLKLEQEQATTGKLAGSVPIVIGRFSNLYGPSQDPTKGQGLIPLLCRASLFRRPLNLYVPMDTVRDYLYVDDAAHLAWNHIAAAIDEQPSAPRTVIIASGQPTTVAEVIATVQNVAHRRVPLALGTHPSSHHQATDLRLVPTGDSIDLTPLPSGIKRVLDATIGQPF